MMKLDQFLGLFVVCLTLVAAVSAQAPAALDIGSRVEPFLDPFLIDTMTGTQLQLQHPVPAEKVLAFDKPWEGRFCGYVTVIKHDLLYYLYYRGRPNAGPDGTDDERLAVGRDLQPRVAVDAEQVEDRLVDDDPEAVADCSELLDHGRRPGG